MATIRRGSTASGTLVWQAPTTISLTSLPTGSAPPPIVVPPINRALWVSFYAFGATTGLPGNAWLLPTPETWRWSLETTDHRPIAVYVSGTPDGSLTSLEQHIAAVKDLGLPVIGYWPRSLQSGRIPRGVDWCGVEAYCLKTETLPVFEARLRQVIARCPNVALISQCYTSNATLTTDLRPLVPVYARLAKDFSRIVAMPVFSGSGRPTGLQDHPEVRPLWNDLAASVSTPTLPLPPDPEPPDPPTPEPPVSFPTDAEFTDFSVRLDTKYASPPMNRPTESTHVDPLGRGRWTYDYSLHRQAGDTHEQAWKKVNNAINAIIGLPPDP